MLFSSHGRWCSRWGRPRDASSSLGHLGVDEPAACGDSNVPDTGRRLQDTRQAADRSIYRGEAFTTSAHSSPRSAPRDQQTVAPAAHSPVEKRQRKQGRRRS